MPDNRNPSGSPLQKLVESTLASGWTALTRITIQRFGHRCAVYTPEKIRSFNAAELYAVMLRSLADAYREMAETTDEHAAKVEKEGADERWAKEAADKAFPGVPDED